jgi:four helix bundle protein
MGYEAIEDKRVYQRAEAISDRVWEHVVRWEWFEKRTVGSQLTRAADSIGANIAEAGGRFHPGDVRNFFYYARGSLRETVYWIRRAHARNLVSAEEAEHLSQELEQLAMEINACIKFQKQRASNTSPPPE